MEVSHSYLEVVGTFLSFLDRRHGKSSSPYVILIVPVINEVT